MEENLFESLLGLEDQYYNEGYQLGNADGARAGHIEGRLFGLEKGFEKYLEMGRLQGKSVVWVDRLPTSQVQGTDNENPQKPVIRAISITSSVPEAINGITCRPKNDLSGQDIAATHQLQQLPKNGRLEKHINTLQAFTEPESLSMQNNEDSVSDFDGRLKRAQGKAKVIEKLIGEEQMHEHVEDLRPRAGGSVHLQNNSRGEESNIEDTNILNARH